MFNKIMAKRFSNLSLHWNTTGVGEGGTYENAGLWVPLTLSLSDQEDGAQAFAFLKSPRRCWPDLLAQYFENHSLSPFIQGVILWGIWQASSVISYPRLLDAILDSKYCFMAKKKKKKIMAKIVQKLKDIKPQIKC